MYRLTLSIVVAVIMSVAAQAADGPTATWKFVELQPGWNGSYLYHLQRVGHHQEVGSDLDEPIIKRLVELLGVKRPEDLAGKTLELPGYWPDRYDIEHWVFLKDHPDYIAPTDQQIRTKSAEALAEGREPSYENVWKGDVSMAFADVFEFRADGSWLHLFCIEVEQLSHGMSKLRVATKDEVDGFAFHVRGPAEYMILTRKGHPDRQVIIGPYNEPVQIMLPRYSQQQQQQQNTNVGVNMPVETAVDNANAVGVNAQ